MDLIALGRRIRALRVKARFTQEKLGEKAEINYRYVGEIERGLKTPSIEVLDRIARGLGVPLEEVIQIEHEKQDIREIHAEINNLLEAASEDELRQALKILRAVRY